MAVSVFTLCNFDFEVFQIFMFFVGFFFKVSALLIIIAE